MRGNGSLDSNTPNIPLRNILENLGYLDNRQTVYVDDNYLSMLNSIHIPENLDKIKPELFMRGQFSLKIQVSVF